MLKVYNWVLKHLWREEFDLAFCGVLFFRPLSSRERRRLAIDIGFVCREEDDAALHFSTELFISSVNRRFSMLYVLSDLLL